MMGKVRFTEYMQMQKIPYRARSEVYCLATYVVRFNLHPSLTAANANSTPIHKTALTLLASSTVE